MGGPRKTKEKKGKTSLVLIGGKKKRGCCKDIPSPSNGFDMKKGGGRFEGGGESRGSRDDSSFFLARGERGPQMPTNYKGGEAGTGPAQKGAEGRPLKKWGGREKNPISKYLLGGKVRGKKAGG